MIEDDPRDEKIFELNEEIKRLKGQITYLQEELASVEDNMATQCHRLTIQIEELERRLGDALYG